VGVPRERGVTNPRAKAKLSPGYGKAQTPSLHTPDAHTFPHDPQFCGLKRRSTQLPLQHVSDPSVALVWQQIFAAPVPQVRLVGQQKGLSPGPTLIPSLCSATCPAGQQSFSFLTKRSGGQQVDCAWGTGPSLPGRIGVPHFWPGGQHVRWPGPVAQHERLFGQQPAFPQH
jgi:hypothetical protein